MMMVLVTLLRAMAPPDAKYQIKMLLYILLNYLVANTGLSDCNLAFLLAPLFVWLEVLFATGYRPALQKRVEAKVNTAITKFKAGQKKAD